MMTGEGMGCQGPRGEGSECQEWGVWPRIGLSGLAREGLGGQVWVVLESHSLASSWLGRSRSLAAW